MPLGGKRPGAGRKKGSKASHTLTAETARAYLIKRVTEELEPILQAQIQAAKGMYIEKVIDDEKVIVYQKPPDIQAAKNLLDQSIGRARETVEVIGEMKLKIDL